MAEQPDLVRVSSPTRDIDGLDRNDFRAATIRIVDPMLSTPGRTQYRVFSCSGRREPGESDERLEERVRGSLATAVADAIRTGVWPEVPHG